MNKIRPLRDEPTPLNKIGVALTYIVLAWMVVRPDVTQVGGLLSLFMLLGILAWALIVRRRSIKYFVRYHVVQALLLNISLAAILWLLVALLDLMNTLPGFQMIAQYVMMVLFQPISVGNMFAASVKDMFIMSVALVVAFYCLQGKYTELPWITDGVRNWI